MSRRQLWSLAASLSVVLITALLGGVASFSHEDDADQGPIADDARGGAASDRTVEMPSSPVALEITFEPDDVPARWEGSVRVADGKLLDLEVIQGGAGSTAEGDRFNVTPAKKKAVANKKKKAAAKKKNQAELPPTIRVLVDATSAAVVALDTRNGQVSLPLGELALDTPSSYLDGRVRVVKKDGAIRLTGRSTEDDYPTLARAADGSVWLAYVEYKPEQPQLKGAIAPDQFDRLVPKSHGDRIRLRRFDGKSWASPVDVTPAGRDVWRPTLAIDGKGIIHVAWSEQREGDWEIYHRPYTPAKQPDAEGTWGDVDRMTDAKGSDFHVVAATDSKGTVWLAWQAFRDGNYDILATSVGQDGAAAKPRTVSDSKANDWGPAIAADRTGRVYVTWDTYDKGQYDVRLRELTEGSEVIPVATSPRFEARPHLACDAQNRVWIAYEEGDEQWGKDFSSKDAFRKVGFDRNPGFALYVNRIVQLKCLTDGKLQKPAAPPADGFPNARLRNKSVPRIAFDADGGLWLLVRQHPLPGGAGEHWRSYATRYDGQAWSPARELLHSENVIDVRPGLVPAASGILAVYTGDSRRAGTQSREQADLFAAVLKPASKLQSEKLEPDSPPEKAKLAEVHPNEADDIARLRGHRFEVGGRTLHPYRGEFHRHTEISSHNDQDGLLEDMWRYALDAASHDWMGNGDHDNGFGFEYPWWITQKSADLHHNPPRFVAAQTYERSVEFPNGHRNVMMPRRGIRPLPRGVLQGTPEEGSPDTKRLYEYLKRFGAICASHTSATDMGTDWRDNDPDVEPVVEIYQGHRHNYETQGAPRSPTAETQIGGYQPSGFIWNALAKGYRLGFQSSSDHVSTHWSYAIILAEEPSRESIVDAFRKRHCYAATDNIMLDVRSGEHIMGDVFDTDQKPTLDIEVSGTSPVTKLDVVRDNRYVFTAEPNQRDVKLKYSDDKPESGKSSYYYVRILQQDGNLAWSSPMWITHKP